MLKIVNAYCVKKSLYRHNIRYCDLPPLSELLKIKITHLRQDGNTLKLRETEFDILVIIQNDHFIQIKNKNDYRQALKDIQDNLVWYDKQLLSADLTDIQKPEPKKDDDENLFSLVYGYDLETYADDDDVFKVYACGFGSV